LPVSAAARCAVLCRFARRRVLRLYRLRAHHPPPTCAAAADLSRRLPPPRCASANELPTTKANIAVAMIVLKFLFLEEC